MTARGRVCVFCARAIQPGEELTGRGDASAHAECADRALADDRYWDAVAAQKGHEPAGDPGRGASAGERRAGCMALLVAVGLAALIAATRLRPR